MAAIMTLHTLLRTCAISAFATLALTAGESGLRGPVSGLIVDSESGSIRPILGSAGAAYAGAAAVRGADALFASPDGERALVAAEGSLFLVHRLADRAPVWLPLRDDASSLGLAVFSSDSAAVALHDAAHHRLELWSGLRDQPASAGAIDLNPVSGRLVSLAVAPDAASVFASFQNSESAAALYLLQPGAAPRLLLTLEQAGALTLHGDVLFVADRARHEVVRVTNWTGAPHIATVASAALGLEDPTGIALSPDGRTLLVASAGTRQVLSIDIQEQALKSALDLSFRPSRLEQSGGLLVLAPGIPGVQPAQVLDPARFEVYFVPVSVLPEVVETGASGM